MRNMTGMRDARDVKYVKKDKDGRLKKIIIFIIIFIIVLISVWFWYNRQNEWVCKDGEWIAQGSPRDSKPEIACKRDGDSELVNESRAMPDKEMVEIDSQKVAEGINIRVMSPTVNATIKSPLKITGEAKGSWFFEASFPVKIVDIGGSVLGEGVAQAQGDSMTDEYVPFKAEIKFDINGSTGGDIIFQKSNPSGLPENAGSFSFPILFEE